MKNTKSRDFRDCGKGNTKPQSNQLLKWCLTWNNYESSKFKDLETFLKSFCWRYMVQSEIGESGTPHLQGCIWLKKAMRYSEFGLPKEIHWEKMISEKGSIEYCQKTSSDGWDGKYRWSLGIPKPIKIIEKLYDWQKDGETLMLAEPDGRSVHWWYDKQGGKGKSSFCKYMVVKHNSVVIQGGKLADIMNIIFNTDMSFVNSVIIDIPRTNKNAISYASIECILNGMITNTKYETGRKIFNPPNVLVLSNYPPDLEQLSQDRWHIKNLASDEDETDNDEI